MSFINRISEAFADIHSPDPVKQEAAAEKTRIIFMDATDDELRELATESGDPLAELMAGRELAKDHDAWHQKMGNNPLRSPLWKDPPENFQELLNE